jgi:hypothetical protein
MLKHSDRPSGDWPAPEEITLELKPVQAFDAELLLPPVLRDWVIDIAGRMSCPPDFVAVAALVSLGSVIGAGCAIKPKQNDSWIVAPNLWGMIVAPPSSKKSPAISEAFKPLDDLVKNARKQYSENQSSFDTEKMVNDSQMKNLKKKLDQATKEEDEKQQGDFEKLKKQIMDFQARNSDMPTMKRYRSNDATIEKFGEMLAENPRGMLMSRDELAGFIASWDKQGHEGARAFYLESWNGFGSFDTDRIGRGSITIPNLCVSIFGGTQPDKLLALLRQASDTLANDGAIQRFQMMVYPDPVKWSYQDRVPNTAVSERIYNLFDKVDKVSFIAIGAMDRGKYAPAPYFHFSDEAQELFKNWTTNLNGKKIPTEETSLMVEHLGKYDKLFCALALIFHIVDCITDNKSCDISLDAAKKAKAWCVYLETHARRCYGLLTDAGMSTAQELIEKIKYEKLTCDFTLRDIQRKGWSGLKKKEDIQDALDWLEDTHWIKSQELRTGASGGRPTCVYEINPKAPM